MTEKENEESLLELYLSEKKIALDNFPRREVLQAINYVWDAYKSNGTVYACGNGGNAASVGNLITDLSNHLFVTDDKTRPLPDDVPRLKTVDLCAAPAAITANLNDFGREYIFSQQLVCNKIGKSDLIFGFSGSGTSGNICKAFEVAKKYGARTILVTRKREAIYDRLVDLGVVFEGHSKFPGQVASNDFNFHYEDLGFAMGHMIVGILRNRIYDEFIGGKES